MREVYDKEKYSEFETLQNRIEIPIMEWADAREQQNMLISYYQKHDVEGRTTHRELHPSATMAFTTASLPYPTHRPAPRIMFSNVQMRQALTMYASNHKDRFDSVGYVHHGQKRLITTRFDSLIDNDRAPIGTNIIMAVMQYDSSNLEDGFLFNKSSAERGLFAITNYHTYKKEEEFDLKKGEATVFGNPSLLGVNQDEMDVVNRKDGDYEKLDQYGFPIPGTLIKKNTPICGLISKATKTSSSGIKKSILLNKSDIAGNTRHGFIDKVHVYKKPNGMKAVKIKTREYRLLKLSNKLVSMNSQKGTVTSMLNQEDMPHTADGIVPDLIFNPLGLPTRMTVSQLMELYFSNFAEEKGIRIDSTAYTTALRKIENKGERILYSGATGKQYPVTIFTGAIYITTNKNMGDDKIFFIDKQKVSQHTRQATGGRKKDGGLSVNQMEINTLIGQGGMYGIQEMMMEKADKFKTVTDRHTGRRPIYNFSKQQYDEDDVDILNPDHIEIPYTLKLLQQEMESAGLKMDIHTEKQPHWFQRNNELMTVGNNNLEDMDIATLDRDADEIPVADE